MSEVVTRLRQLGFAEYEAKAYAALIQRSPLNGYELAKLSGVPRADIYAVLQRLEARGAAARLDTEGGTRYVPVSPEDVLRRAQAGFEEAVEAARRSLEEITTPSEYGQVLNARGYPLLLAHAGDLIDGAYGELLIAAPRREAEALGEKLAAAEARGVAIVTLCVQACPRECGYCRGQIHRYRVEPESATPSIVLVRDQSELLIGEIGEGEDALVVRTGQRLLVQLATWHLKNSVAVATIVADLGERLESLLKPESTEVLASLGLAGEDNDWLDHMRHLTPSGSQPYERFDNKQQTSENWG